MKIVSFNINGIRARLHQLKALIDKHQPDVIGLQEIKVHDDAFPLGEVQAAAPGYQVHHFGQKAHYGVALLTRTPAINVTKGFPGDGDEAQRRIIMVTVASPSGERVTVLNGYFPQGENRDHPLKFPAKEKFYADLIDYLQAYHQPQQNLVVIGDMNISPTDLDIGIGENNAKRWLKTGKCSFLPEERDWMNTLLGWGLEDTFRQVHPQRTECYSWFDYRSRGFDDNRGLRIDLILASHSMATKVCDSDVDYELRGMDKPSDHAPVWTTFDI